MGGATVMGMGIRIWKNISGHSWANFRSKIRNSKLETRNKLEIRNSNYTISLIPMKNRKKTSPFEFRIFVLTFFILHSSFYISSAATTGGRPSPRVPAFPGAEGAGAITPGGRGGKVYEVTTLADRGPGSLREAFAATEPRIVVFRVSGIITLTNRLPINHPFITV